MNITAIPIAESSKSEKKVFFTGGGSPLKPKKPIIDALKTETTKSPSLSIIETGNKSQDDDDLVPK